MTIIVASTDGKEIYFAYDTAVSNDSFGSMDSWRKVKSIERGDVAIGFSGTPMMGFAILGAELGRRCHDRPLDVIKQFLNKYPNTRDWVSMLLGIVDNGTTKLFAYDIGTKFLLRKVQTYGIGSGMYQEVVDKLMSEHSRDIRAHLGETVKFAKELDRERKKVLSGFGESRLGLDGFQDLSYRRAHRGLEEICT